MPLGESSPSASPLQSSVIKCLCPRVMLAPLLGLERGSSLRSGELASDLASVLALPCIRS